MRKAPDENVEAIREMLLQRSIVGLDKYGVTTERTDLSLDQWLVHAIEEALDMSVYLQRIRVEIADRMASAVVLNGPDVQHHNSGVIQSPTETQGRMEVVWHLDDNVEPESIREIRRLMPCFVDDCVRAVEDHGFSYEDVLDIVSNYKRYAIIKQLVSMKLNVWRCDGKRIYPKGDS